MTSLHGLWVVESMFQKQQLTKNSGRSSLAAVLATLGEAMLCRTTRPYFHLSTSCVVVWTKGTTRCFFQPQTGPKHISKWFTQKEGNRTIEAAFWLNWILPQFFLPNKQKSPSVACARPQQVITGLHDKGSPDSHTSSHVTRLHLGPPDKNHVLILFVTFRSKRFKLKQNMNQNMKTYETLTAPKYHDHVFSTFQRHHLHRPLPPWRRFVKGQRAQGAAVAQEVGLSKNAASEDLEMLKTAWKRYCNLKNPIYVISDNHALKKDWHSYFSSEMFHNFYCCTEISPKNSNNKRLWTLDPISPDAWRSIAPMSSRSCKLRRHCSWREQNFMQQLPGVSNAQGNIFQILKGGDIVK